MRCGTGHPETRSPSLGSTRLRSVPGHRPSLRPTRSWPWPLQPIPVSPLAGRPLTRLRARFKSNVRSEEHTSELQSHSDLVCRLLLEKKKKNNYYPSKTNKMIKTNKEYSLVI